MNIHRYNTNHDSLPTVREKEAQEYKLYNSRQINVPTPWKVIGNSQGKGGSQPHPRGLLGGQNGG